MLKKFLRVLLLVTIAIGLVIPVVTPAQAKKISLNKTSASLYEGKTVKLELSNATGKITWSSSNEAVATVGSKGKVKALSAGKATITAKNNGIKYTCKITVKEPFMAITEKELLKGETVKLALTGDTAVSYISDDTVVATVNKYGKVTAKAAGTATITVEGKSGKTYTCIVTVTLPEPTDHKHILVKIEKVAPDCENTGLTTGEKCAVCGEITIPQKEVPAVGHKYSNGYCKVCKKADPDSVHVHVYMVQDKVDPTCTTDGLTDGVYCATCNEVFKPQKTVAKLGHNLVNGTCTRCELHFHEKVEIKAVEASCLVDGSTAGAICKYCGEVLIPINVIKCPGSHSFGPDGHCIRCTADRNGHIHNWIITKAVKATCEECGFTEGKKCDGCGYIDYAPNIVPPTGHVFANGRCRFCGKAE